MQRPAAMVTDEWLYLSTAPTAITGSSVSHLSRGANDPEMIVDSIILSEKSGNADVATVRKVASGGTDDATSNIFTDVPLASKETLIIPEADSKNLMYLSPGDSIKFLTSGTASRILATINYRKRR